MLNMVMVDSLEAEQISRIELLSDPLFIIEYFPDHD